MSVRRSLSITVTGDKELAKAFNQLPVTLQDDLFKKATRVSLDGMKKTAATALAGKSKGGGLHEAAARSLRITFKKRRYSISGRLGVRYPKRTKPIPEDNPVARVALSHLLEFGFSHPGGAHIEGEKTMTAVFDAHKRSAEARFRIALRAWCANPKIKVGSVKKIADALEPPE